MQFYGNAPCGFYKYHYPKVVQKEVGSVGAKVKFLLNLEDGLKSKVLLQIFFYIAKYRSGEISQENLEYKWLDRQELHKELPAAYSHSVAQFLIDEH